MTIEQFWNSTPKEFHIQSAAFQFKADQTFQYSGWIAWHTAALTRMKKMPPLKKFLTVKKPQTTQDQLKMVEALNMKFKGKDLRKNG